MLAVGKGFTVIVVEIFGATLQATAFAEELLVIEVIVNVCPLLPITTGTVKLPLPLASAVAVVVFDDPPLMLYTIVDTTLGVRLVKLKVALVPEHTDGPCFTVP